MTIRRAQGSTVDAAGLWFNHCYPADRGYAYVGSSPVRRATDLFLMGKTRRTDWLPVGGDPDGGEQTCRDIDSESSDEEERELRNEEGWKQQQEGSESEERAQVEPEAEEEEEPHEDSEAEEQLDESEIEQFDAGRFAQWSNRDGEQAVSNAADLFAS